MNKNTSCKVGQERYVPSDISIGDWIMDYRNTNPAHIFRADKKTVKSFQNESGTLSSKIYNSVRWYPKVGEYHWFSDFEDYAPVLGKLLKIDKDDTKTEYIVKLQSGFGESYVHTFTYIEPFRNGLAVYYKGSDIEKF